VFDALTGRAGKACRGARLTGPDVSGVANPSVPPFRPLQVRACRPPGGGGRRGVAFAFVGEGRRGRTKKGRGGWRGSPREWAAGIDAIGAVVQASRPRGGRRGARAVVCGWGGRMSSPAAWMEPAHRRLVLLHRQRAAPAPAPASSSSGRAPVPASPRSGRGVSGVSESSMPFIL
jgi:hypothetical protein